MHQPVRDVFADTVAALHHPHPIGEPSALGQHILKVRDRVGGVHHLANQSSGVTGALLVAMAS